ncbi:MAG: hypothetical protein EP330_08570 [Deltaproteobacteria bacterium]|nr:MAG: hypothetical protein EP330_08570 [Deltaproteobacteria bacterium]
MPSPKPRRIRLSIANRTSDHPAQLTAWGRVKGGEVAMVLRADTGEGMLVHRTTGKSATSHVWTCSGPDLEAPNAPVDTGAEVATFERFKALMGSPEAGPVTLRGQWTGVLLWGDGAPVVELWRKLSTYGKLTITSKPGMGWSWAFEREAKWFSTQADESGEGYASLSAAIEAGIQGARAMLGTACSFRDSHRRAAHDATYAASHPIGTPAPAQDRLAARLERERESTSSRPSKRSTPSSGGTEITYEPMPRERGESAYTWARRLLSEATSRVGEGHHHVARELIGKVGEVAATLSSGKAKRLYEGVAHVEQRLAESSAPAPKKRKSRRPKAQASSQSPSTSSPSGNTPNAQADAQLLSLFQQAVAAAVEGA